MNVTTKNILANTVGKIWGILSAFVFIPLYINLLGFESYSIISYTLIIAGIITILDSGLTATLSREFARQDKTPEDKKKVYETLEITFGGIIIFAILLIILLSNFLATNINSSHYTQFQISNFLKLVSVDIGFQLLFRFYQGGLLGLEEQVKANIYLIGLGIMRNALVLLLIYLYPSLNYFFVWQSISTILFTLLIKLSLDRKVFNTKWFNFKNTFNKKIFIQLWRFAAGMMLISVVAAFNTQLDKIAISKLMKIESLGYYTLAISIANSLIVLINPIATALLPKFTGMYSKAELTEARNLFNKANVIISILIFSFMATFIFFSKEILWVWTGKENIVTNTSIVLPIVAVSYAFIALQVLPYHIAIANAYTRMNNILGISSLLITIPGYIIAIKYYGALGAAIIFLIVQVIAFFIYIIIINKKFIKEQIWKKIIFQQTIVPVVISVITCFILRNLPITTFSHNRIFIFIWLSIIILINLSLSFLINLPKQSLNIINNILYKIKPN